MRTVKLLAILLITHGAREIQVASTDKRQEAPEVFIGVKAVPLVKRVREDLARIAQLARGSIILAELIATRAFGVNIVQQVLQPVPPVMLAKPMQKIFSHV